MNNFSSYEQAAWLSQAALPTPTQKLASSRSLQQPCTPPDSIRDHRGKSKHPGRNPIGSTSRNVFTLSLPHSLLAPLQDLAGHTSCGLTLSLPQTATPPRTGALPDQYELFCCAEKNHASISRIFTESSPGGFRASMLGKLTV